MHTSVSEKLIVFVLVQGLNLERRNFPKCLTKVKMFFFSFFLWKLTLYWGRPVNLLINACPSHRVIVLFALTLQMARLLASCLDKMLQAIISAIKIVCKRTALFIVSDIWNMCRRIS